MVHAKIDSLEQTLCVLFKEFSHAALFPEAQKYGLVAGFSNVSKSISLSDNEPSSDWAFGHLSYDLKNELEILDSSNIDSFQFEKTCVFSPQVLIVGDTIFVEEALASHLPDWLEPKPPKIKQRLRANLEASIDRDEYLARVHALIQQIRLGNIYEITYSIEHAGLLEISNPVKLFLEGQSRFNAPMSCLYKQEGNWLLCFSPERYLRIEGERVISQPIKGTARRGLDVKEDTRIADHLKSSTKEVSENVMIVDLVRNDLSRVAMIDSVKVDELCGLYSFPAVHQLISTVSANLRPEVGFSDVIRATFPMGSMTGAPKISAMRLIDQNEMFSRSLYSGTVFWRAPDGTTDMNVVIRSILWDENRKFGAIRTGGAITVLSDPEDEYQECLLKAEALIKLLQE